VPEYAYLRDRGDAELAAQIYQLFELGAVELFVGIGELGVAFVREYAPRLEDDVVEFVVGRQPNHLFELLEGSLGKYANVYSPKFKRGFVADIAVGQNVSVAVARCFGELPQGLQPLPYPDGVLCAYRKCIPDFQHVPFPAEIFRGDF